MAAVCASASLGPASKWWKKLRQTRWQFPERRWRRSIRANAKYSWRCSTGCGEATPNLLAKQSIDAKRISEAYDIAWRVVVQPDGEMKIDLLGSGQMKHATGIPKLARNRTLGIVADIFGEQVETFGQIFLQNEGRLRDASGRKIVGTKKFGEHAADTPPVVQFI